MITATSVSVHPFAPVTVTVYVPAAFPVIVGEFAPVVIFPPDEATHEYVPPPVAVKSAADTVQSIAPSDPASAVGGVRSVVTVVTSVSVHPFEPVTVTVYVPAAFAVGVAVLDPDVILPPPEATQE